MQLNFNIQNITIYRSGYFMAKNQKSKNLKPVVEEVPCVYPTTEELKIMLENAYQEDKEAIDRAILYLKDH